MIVLCIESSVKRGMGHLFRTLNFIKLLKTKNESYIVLVNDDVKTVEILQEAHILYEVVNYDDFSSGWVERIIAVYSPRIWWFDKFSTEIELVERVRNKNILVVAVDDCGPGADLVDINFCGLLFNNQKGKRIFTGTNYIILNPEIEKFRRKRVVDGQQQPKVLVTLGGSDTYGVTIPVVEYLLSVGIQADIVVGPNFTYNRQLQSLISKSGLFNVYSFVPSLIEHMSHYDVAITGGGVTCVETNASGLPSVIIANEIHEIEIAKYVSSYGGAVFAGYYKRFDKSLLDVRKLPLNEMSKNALNAFDLRGAERIYEVIKEYLFNG